MREYLTKIEVAKRQLRAAIRLVFDEEDAVAVHTMVAAAHQIVDDLCQHWGLEGLRKNNPYIRPGKEKQWNDGVNKAQNFFKHADNDPEGVLEFNPELPHFYLFDALQRYRQLAQDPVLLDGDGLVYLVWFAAKYPHLLDDSVLKSALAAALGHGFDPENSQQMRSLLYSKE